MIFDARLTEQLQRPDFRARNPVAQAVFEYIEERRRRVAEIDNSGTRDNVFGGVMPGMGLWEKRAPGLPYVPFTRRFSETVKRREGNRRHFPSLF